MRPPTVTITDAALRAFHAAFAEASTGDLLRLNIDARFFNELSFGPAEPNDVVITTSGITIAMDASTAKRAHGLKIDFVDADEAGFKLENPNQSSPVKGVRPADVRQMLERGERFEFIDVRSKSERATARVDGSRLLDEQYEAALLALPRNAKLVFMCHHSSGGQSSAQQFFDRGFTNVGYVVGGIDAWSTMDPRVPRY